MKQLINNAYLLIGGNMGDRLVLLQQAVSKIEASAGTILKKSSVYETAAWGKTDQHAFLNQALLVATGLEPEPLLHQLLAIEQEMGRQRKERFGPRLMDIDIIFFNKQVINTADLTVPHPQMHLRRFVLQPLAEIAPDYLHPQLNTTVQELLAVCTDPLKVHKL